VIGIHTVIIDDLEMNPKKCTAPSLERLAQSSQTVVNGHRLDAHAAALPPRPARACLGRSARPHRFLTPFIV
jgi:hypothetical protein